MVKRKTKARQKRTDRELLRASLAVQYEVATMGSHLKMLLESNTWFDNPPEERAVSNALSSNLLLAARSLLAFLYSHNVRPDDIIAEDFFDDAAIWHDARPDLPDGAREGRLSNDISKRLAHLTWARASGTKPMWGLFSIVWIVMVALEAFLATVPGTRVQVQLREDVVGLALWLRQIRNQYGGDEAEMAPLSTTIPFDEAAYFGGRDPFGFDGEE